MSFCLSSSFPALELWALTHFPAACDQDRHFLQLVPSLISLFSSPHPVVEYTAITCVNALLRRFAKTVAASLLTNVLDRLNAIPAIEYVQCLVTITPCFTDITVTSCILPLIARFVTRSESFQYAIGEFATSVDFKQLQVTTETFIQFTQSKVIVNEYLVSLIRLAEGSGCVTSDWIHRIFVNEIMTSAGHNRSIRVGAVRVVLAVADGLLPKQFYGHLVTMFRWAAEGTDVGLALLSKADEIMTPRTIHLFPDFRQLLAKICQSQDVELRLRLPGIVSLNPTVFLGNGVNLDPVLKMLAADRNPEIQLFFLANFVTLFGKSSGSDAQTALFRLFRDNFNEPTPEIRSKLLSSVVFPLLGPHRMSEIAPLFVDLLATVTNWHDVDEAFLAYLTFPIDSIRANWRAAVPVFFRQVCRCPFPLVESCRRFCAKLLAVLGPEIATEFTSLVIGTFFEHDWFSVRQIGPALAAAISSPGQAPEAVDMLFQAISELSQDPVVEVRASIFGALVSLKRFYGAQLNHQAERKTAALYMSFRQSSDPFLAAKWDENAQIFTSLPRAVPKTLRGSLSHAVVPLSVEPKVNQVLPSLTQESGLTAPGWVTPVIPPRKQSLDQRLVVLPKVRLSGSPAPIQAPGGGGLSWIGLVPALKRRHLP
jgi:hypothetical protein